MQTFLPYEDFTDSAEALDTRRLWKQVVEAKQILCTLHYKSVPDDWKNTGSWANQMWKRHPAVIMWVGSEGWLADYFNAFLSEAKDRGVNTPMRLITSCIASEDKPWWLGIEEFHRAMRSRLIEKAPDFYGSKWPNDKGYNQSKYWWPIMDGGKSFKTI